MKYIYVRWEVLRGSAECVARIVLILIALYLGDSNFEHDAKEDDGDAARYGPRQSFRLPTMLQQERQFGGFDRYLQVWRTR